MAVVKLGKPVKSNLGGDNGAMAYIINPAKTDGGRLVSSNYERTRTDHDALAEGMLDDNRRSPKGIRKNSRLAAACQMPAYSELTIFKRGSWYMLDEASPIELFDGLGRDIELLALAAWFCELTEAVCAEETPCPEILSLLLNALYALCRTGKDPRLVKAAFQFRLMALSGFEPLAEECAVCGTAQPEGPVLDISGGFVACGTCRGPERSFRLPLTEAGLAALRHVLYADPRRLYSFTLEPGALQALDQAGEAFIAAQLERGFRTLDYYKALLG